MEKSSMIEGAGDLPPLPKGIYKCLVADVTKTQTSRGDTRWRLRLEIDEGEHAGRVIFDDFELSPTGKYRRIIIAQRFGSVAPEIKKLMPEMLVGHRCRVNVEVEKSTDRDGRQRALNKVPFAGYFSIEPRQYPGRRRRRAAITKGAD